MAIIAITTTAGIEKLYPYWSELLRRTYSPEVFRTWAWMFTWWQVFHDDHKRTSMLVAQEGSDITAIAPLYVEEKEGLLRRGQAVRLLGDDVVGSDFLDWIVPWKDEDRLCVQLVDAMLEMFDRRALFDFRDVAADSVVARRVVPLMIERGLKVRKLVRYRCPYLELPPSFGELERRFSPSTRESLRRKLRKLDSHGEWELWQGGREIALEDALRLVWYLHDRRWAGRTGDSTQHPRFREFHAKLLERLRNHVEIAVLRIHGRPAAAQYNFRFDGKLYQYQSGFDPDFASLSPGMALMMLVLKRAIQDGLHRFEMLRGDEGYKGHFTRSQRFTYRILASRSPVVLSRALGPVMMRNAKRQVLARLLNNR